MLQELKRFALKSVVAVLLIAVGFGGAFIVVPNVVYAIDDIGLPMVNTNDLLISHQGTYNQIYDTVAPSVVAITIEGRQSASSAWEGISSGSGFVVDQEGNIVTNTHVIDTALTINQQSTQGVEARVVVSMFDGTITEAEIIGADRDSDIAVVRVNVSPDRLRPVSFADSDLLDEGQIVFALGNPFSNDWTLTTGIISALNRSIPGLQLFQTGGVIQTDAAINPGNSGGPLVNINGQVIGVNSQINSESGSNSGIGFAVPSNLVVRVANEIIETGEVSYSFLGITSAPISLSLIEAYNLPNNIRGVPIGSVTDGFPASNAGLQSASQTGVDIITAVEGRPIADFDELIGYLSIQTAPGDTVNFTVYRNGQIFQVPVTLSERPN
ncbi:MAG: trypsin-like peptidase domain-containing protein [Chloroflexota bacterium]